MHVDMIIRLPIGLSYQQLWWHVLRIKWGANVSRGGRDTPDINISLLIALSQDPVFYVARKICGVQGQVSVVSN